MCYSSCVDAKDRPNLSELRGQYLASAAANTRKRPDKHMQASQHIQLKEVAEVFTGPPAPAARVRTVLRDAGPIAAPLLTVGAIRDRAVLPSAIKTVFADTESVLANYRVTKGDILLAARTTLMRCMVVPPELDGAVVSASVLAIRCNTALLLPRMLMAFFEHPAGQAKLLGMSQSTTVQHSLTVRALRELDVPIPPIEVQRRMAGLLEAADAQREAAEESIRIRYQTALHLAVTSMTQNANGDGGSSK